MKDQWTETLRRKEKADEDRYFAEQDRKLIEKLHRQHQPAQEADTASQRSLDGAKPAERNPGSR